MKRLILLRHAKSDWSDAFLSDHDRPLNKRGQRTAAQIGNYFQLEEITPDHVFCSTAKRAQETLERLQQTALSDFPVSFLAELYGAGVQTLVSLVQDHGAPYDTVMLVGHNPCIEDAAIALTGRDDSGLLPTLYQKVPTGSLIVLDFDVKSFAHISLKSGSLKQFFRPKIELFAALNSKSPNL